MTSPPAPASGARATCPVEDMRVAAFRIPTERPESDGTLEWTSTTLVVVELTAAGHRGLGYTYASGACTKLINDALRELVCGADVFHVDGITRTLFAQLRNQGRQGLVACAVSAIDCALWDLKAKLLGLPLVDLLGSVRHSAPVYGSGGFTSYDDDTLRAQLEDWAKIGITRFKMKVGRDPDLDPDRVRIARATIGPTAELFVDGNGAYTPRRAIAAAHRFAAEADVSWLEQPLAIDDYDGLRFVRDHLPVGVELASGEYGYDLGAFRRLLCPGAVDVLMADVTRCGGVTGLIKVGTLCETWHVPLSTHCAPSLHLHVACALEPIRHIEYFHDHARIEHELFDGAAEPRGGSVAPDRTRPGLGLEFKWVDAERFAV